MAHARTPVTLTDEDMKAAFAQLARRDWPSLPELTRAAGLYQLVRGAALRRASGLASAIEAPPAEAHGAVVQTPAPAPAPLPAAGAAPARAGDAPHRLPLRPPSFDHKRAAAGERDEFDDGSNDDA